MRRAAQRARRVLVDDFPIVLDEHIARRAAGGRRRLHEATSLQVRLGRERIVTVELRSRAWCYGGQRVYLVCPTCQRTTVVLRAVPSAPWLACKTDLVRRYGAKYPSQLHRPRPRRAEAT